MGEEKKSESSWEESERLGPYQLHEQVPQPSRTQGDLYHATHETSGAAALVFKPARDAGDSETPTDWEVSCISSSDPRYVAVEVEKSPWTFAPDKHSVEELVCMFEDLHKAMRRMARLLPSSNEPRPRWRPGLAWAVGIAALTLTWGVLSAAQAPATESQEQAQQEQESAEEAWATDVNVGPEPVQPGEAPRPVRNQKRAPCTAGLEIEVSGACWLPIEQRPCPPQTKAYQGRCLLPVAVPRPPVTSLDGGDSSEPH